MVGSECVRHFDRLGHEVRGIDNNQRRIFFGPDGDTTPTLERLKQETGFTHYKADIRNYGAMMTAFKKFKPEIVLHCAAQPSHDLAAKQPLEDFSVNAVGTLNLLEATRTHCPEAVFCFASTNKVYGDAPNEWALRDMETRFDYAFVTDGVDEMMRIDQSRHSLFGCSKLAADVLVQEYAKAFNLRTACFRAGCLTGSAHAAAEQHGFLAYIARCAKEDRLYTIFGYDGKQVRDNLHAFDVARAFEEFADDPQPGEVYNLGGGKDNSVSVLEAIQLIAEARGKPMNIEYADEPRPGDHVCYYTDTTKFRKRYPAWKVTRNLPSIFEELVA